MVVALLDERREAALSAVACEENSCSLEHGREKRLSKESIECWHVIDGIVASSQSESRE